MGAIKNLFLSSAVAGVALAHGDLTKRAGLTAGSIYTKCLNQNHVALTFDDGPAQYTAELLDKLKPAGHKATFFVCGNNYGKLITDYTSVVQRMASEGHQISSHTYSHADLATLDEAGITSEMTKLEDQLMGIIGKFPTTMRPPYLSTNAVAEATLKKLGYAIINIDIDTYDWQEGPAGRIQNSINWYQGNYTKGGTLSLNHDPLEWTVQTFIPATLEFLKSKGKTSVTVAECLGVSEADMYRTSRNGVSSASSSRASSKTSSSSKVASSSSARASSSSVRASSSSARAASSSSARAASASSVSSTSARAPSSASSAPASSRAPVSSESASSRGPVSSESASSRAPSSRGPASSRSSSSRGPRASSSGEPASLRSASSRGPQSSQSASSRGPASSRASASSRAPSSRGPASSRPTSARAPASSRPAVASSAPGPKASGVTSPNWSCGGDKGYVCPSGYCCSPYGWCGKSSTYCGVGCQSSFGTCSASSGGSNGGSGGSGSTPTGPIDGKDGKCGGSTGYVCPGNCCSQYGYCGSSKAYCGAGCQSAFGTCSK